MPVAVKRSTVAALILILSANLLAADRLLAAEGDGGRGGGGHPLPAVLPSLHLGRLALAVDEASALTGRLSPDRGQARLYSTASSPPVDTQSESRWNRRLYLSAALTISAGVLARWTKQEADRSYDNYLQSAGPKRQTSTFDRAQRYDRLSGAALVTMEVGLVLSTYLVFF